MELFNQYHEIAAVCIARIFLGLLFFFQGYDSTFNIKIKNVIATYQNAFANKGIPRSLTVCASWFTSCSALIGGFLLVIGLFEYVVVFLLGFNLIMAAIGFGINTPMWDTRFVFPRLILVLFLLFTTSEQNAWSLDYLLFYR